MGDANAAKMDSRRLELKTGTWLRLRRRSDLEGLLLAGRIEERLILLKFKFVIVYFRRWKVEPAVESGDGRSKFVRVVSS